MKLSLFGFNMLTTLPLGQLYHDRELATKANDS